MAQMFTDGWIAALSKRSSRPGPDLMTGWPSVEAFVTAVHTEAAILVRFRHTS